MGEHAYRGIRRPRVSPAPAWHPRCCNGAGRSHDAALTRALAAQGYAVSERRCRFDALDATPFRGRLLSYRRGTLQ